MIREHLFDKRAPADPDFRWRGGDVSRLEAISDGVFAITITLLVVSTTAPKTFYDMWLLVRDLPAFIASFAMIMMAWHSHYLFFRRYGLEDATSSLINSAFLFVIMFFAFPLKFLCTFLWYLIIGEPTAELFVFPEGFEISVLFGDMPLRQVQRIGMMYLYGFGLIGVFGLLAIFQLRAIKLKQQLELDELENVLTSNVFFQHLITVSVAVISLFFLKITGNPGVSGIIYFALPIFHIAMKFIGDSRIKTVKSLPTND